MRGERSFTALVLTVCMTNLAYIFYTMAVVTRLYQVSASAAVAIFIVSVSARIVSNTCLPLFVDRLRTRSLLGWAQAVQLVIAMLIWVLVQFENKEDSMDFIVILFILIAIISFFNGWIHPLKSTYVRLLVVKKRRVRANSILSTIDHMFLFAGWALGGVFVALLGINVALLVTVVLTIIAMLMLFLLPVGRRERKGSEMKERWSKRLASGWRVIWKQPFLRTLIIMDGWEAWAGTIWIAPVTFAYTEQVLQEGEAWWGYINGIYYLGTFAGGWLVYRFATRMEKKIWIYMVLGAASFGLLTLIYGLTSQPWLALVLVFLMGPAYQMRDLAQETMIQNSTDAEALTKVMAARSSMVQVIFLFSMLIITSVITYIGVEWIYIAAGMMLLVSAGYGASCFSRMQTEGSLLLENTRGERVYE
ncbi:MFS transporter [Mechercharimyces sp. CAU 1602]|uniref:MFS transporter n=1 Tax=Mechercharimyces sp. CAU 1602 TaxID=2973933 RepID=UPI00216145C9|nr:MFS transporter [Mechercharimyces sp. CAU 1602]MCS1351565.1 MFS transporter [Mechercharimyces sp. CAU 1602]